MNLLIKNANVVDAYESFYGDILIIDGIITEIGKEINKESLINYEEISGHGIKVNIEGNEVLLGNYKLMNKFNIKFI